ncbi:MAG TPA: NBR1-Ig-like domain-containing protein [Anaerolineales bacterium]|nr:NBR1-Ig-like domain-containing protein [Anaerolineales bacterium]
MKLKLTVSVLLIAVLITACGGANPPQEQEPTPDVAVIRTSAASTVISQFTLTAAAFSPTPSGPTETTAPSTPSTPSTPGATNTATTQPIAQVTNAQGTTVALCDSLEFVADVTIPDDTNMAPGQDFLKTWRVKNTGSCPWGEGYELVYADYANDMDGQPQPLTEVVQPGQEVEISVQFTAPSEIGNYLSAWQMENPAGVTFEEIIFVRIIVQ